MIGGPDERPAITFVVPCYNEARNVAATVAEIELAAKGADVASFEIVVVNDCSSDDTGEVVRELSATDRRIRLITNSKNLGFGGAYKEGVKNAKGIHVIMIPGDNAHPHAGISPILRRAGEADIVIPYVKNPEARSWVRQFMSRCFTRLLNALFGLDVPYFNGLVLHKLDLLKAIEIRTNGFAYQAEALIKLISGGASYVTIPVEISERSVGKTAAFRVKNVYRVLKTILAVWIDLRRSPKIKLDASRISASS